ncbi:YbfB/YjiJ family MFS transporter [Spongiibacter nanhainus]|uniref:YbfB/YjiJ family MFS transporter n=1 Tax=Spongiibacter nanhainus TaxID=2794344 RepID=A0A7T4URZ2_9GAMM|nr:YbfB/YjiJ family MFS transporter [Spongiibacter nanhainus]QQD18905.1 YbfB/YjiJ family MFS transporter [Spongiibacter nanhainus]
MAPHDNGALRIALAGAFSLVIALGIGRFLFTPALPDMIASTTLNAVSGGYLAAVNYGGYLLGAMLAMAVPSHRARSAFWCALWVSAITSLLMALSDTFIPWAINRFLAGVASAIIMVNGSALVLGALPNHLRARLGNIHYAGIGLGISIAALTVALIESLSGSYPVMWFACGGIALLLMAFLRVIPALPHASEHAHTRTPVNRKALTLLIASYTLAGFGYITSTTYLPVIARQQLPGLDNAAFYTWLAVGLAAIPANLLWGRLASHAGERNALMMALVVQASGVSAPAWIPGLSGLVVSGLLVGGTFTAVVALSMYCGRQLAPHAPSMALGALTACYGVGQILGPVVTARMLESSGSFAPGLLGAAIALVGAALLMLPLSQRRF